MKTICLKKQIEGFFVKELAKLDSRIILKKEIEAMTLPDKYIKFKIKFNHGHASHVILKSSLMLVSEDIYSFEWYFGTLLPTRDSLNKQIKAALSKMETVEEEG